MKRGSTQVVLPCWVQGCDTMQYFRDMLSLDGKLSKNEAERRKQCFVWSFICVFVTLLYLLATLRKQLAQKSFLAGAVLVTIGFGSVVGTVLRKAELSERLVAGSMYVAAVGILLWDLNARTLSSSRWPLLVVIVDFMLIMRVPTRYSTGLVGLIVVWLVLLGVEESFRFGLFDLPGLSEQEGEYGRVAVRDAQHICAGDPLPCAQSFPPPLLISAVSVFVMDFIITRGFANEVLKEQASMEKTINAVQEIASLLAKYDVEGVARMLAARGSELPEEMYETLQTMEQNLRRYKPYLPAALFDEMEEEGDREKKSLLQRLSVAPPGLTSETATIVFTDIRASTSMGTCT